MADFPSILSDEELSDEEQVDHDEVDGAGDSTWEWVKDKARGAMYTAMGDILSAYYSFGDEPAKYAAVTLNGGPRRQESVAVVGGGPAGVHMAYYLFHEGFHNVTIFEKTDRIGGKSMSFLHRDVVHELGTCYISPDYEEVKQLLRDFNVAEQVEVVGRDVFEPESSDRALPFRKWIFREVAKALGQPDLGKGACALAVFKQAFSYTDLHKRLLGQYNGFLMRRPEKAALEELNCSISEFLDKHKLNALRPVFLLAYSLQGYGFLERTSALYGLLWVTPTLLVGLIEQVKFRKALKQTELSKRPAGERKTITTLVRGFQRLWEAMVERMDGIHVERRAEISAIRRDASGTHITFTNMKTKETNGKRFDFLVVAAPIQDVLPVLDAREEETKIFSKLQTSTFVTTLFDFKPKRSRTVKEPAIDSWFANIRPNNEYAVWSFRDTHHLLRQSKVQVRVEDEDLATGVSYQFAERPIAGNDLEVIKERHAQHFERQGYTNMTIQKVQPWSYFPHYGIEDMSAGVLWDILEMQGKYRTWYTGAWASFESVNAIVSYNKMLVDVWAEQIITEHRRPSEAMAAMGVMFGAPASKQPALEEEPAQELADV